MQTPSAQNQSGQALQCVELSTVQKITISGTSATTASAVEGVVRIVSSTDCFFVVGNTASATDNYLPAGAIEYIHITEASNISFIQSTASGFATVTKTKL